jgi:hypothetical protein
MNKNFKIMKQMNYGFGDGQTKTTTSPFPVGVAVENVEITDCKYVSGEKNGKEWEAIEVTYTRKGTSINDRMFFVNPDNVTTRPYIPGDTHEDAVAERVRVFNTQLLHIATKLGLDANDLSVCNTAKSTKGFAETYCGLIKSNCKGVLLYAKTISDGGYTKISRNSSNTVPFLQCMSDGECELAYTPKEIIALQNATAPKNGVSGARVSTDWVETDSL